MKCATVSKHSDVEPWSRDAIRNILTEPMCDAVRSPANGAQCEEVGEPLPATAPMYAQVRGPESGACGLAA